MPSLTVVVPATNRPSTLPACLAAIRAADDAPEELIVVDGPAGAGPARARNAGAWSAAGEILVFVDADVVVHDDVFRRLRFAFEADRELAAVFGSYDDGPTAEGVVSAFRNLLHHHVHQEAAGPATTFWAGVGAIRREVFLRAGGFDADRYDRPSIEDVELGMRLSGSGACIVLDPRILGTHLKTWTLADMIRTDFARRGVPWVELLLRRGRGSSALNLGWRHRLSALACLGVALGVGTRRPPLAVGSALALVALNRSFYGLLLRRRGPAEAAAGVGLHAVHHLVAVAAVPAGVLAHLRNGTDPGASVSSDSTPH